MSYIDVIKDKARMDKKTIVLPETTDKRTLIAASNIVQEGIADIIMIGNEEKIIGCMPGRCSGSHILCDSICRGPEGRLGLAGEFRREEDEQ